MNDDKCIIFNWNVCGLNSVARRDVVRGLVNDHRCNVVCLQETKLACVDDNVIIQTLGQQFVGSYFYLPAQGTRGGVIVACSHDLYTLQSVTTGQYSISAIITSRADNSQWSITGVYGPQEDQEKIQFISEMCSLRHQMLPSWIILGDFNLIYRACDKNTDRVNRGMMHRFKSALDNLELKEIHLHGRKYTWSSETDSPILTKIDHVFCTKDWEMNHQHSYMQALSSSASDHCPMLLSCNPFHKAYAGFRFEAYWLRLPGFAETVVESWTKPCHSNDKIRVLHIKTVFSSNAKNFYDRILLT